MRQKARVESYDAPAGGWGSLNAVMHILTQEEVAILGSEILLKQNKPGGFMCVSCSWAKPASPHPFEFCENGAKATAWEITGKTVTPEFFAQHTLAELRNWSDRELEDQGRLTHPMRYDPANDKYAAIDWSEAFREIGIELNQLDPRSVIMYTSGRASLEASYMYQLFGRMYGTNNFPDSSNMCHETTSVALPQVIGSPVGTVLLGRIEIDEQASDAQAVSMEDSTACIHGSRGQRKSVAKDALSEAAIIAGLAKATLKPNPKVDWDAWIADYSRVRDAIERTYPDQFKDFNKRMFEPGGFPRPLPARERKWKTPNGKANFTVPKAAFAPPKESDVYELMTMRADGQFNTTIYTEDDRFRGIRGSRYVVLMNPADMNADGLKSGDTVTLVTEAGDGVERSLSELQVVPYDIPRRTIAGYYPECTGLIPLWHYAEGSKVPAAKSVPVRVFKDIAPRSSKAERYRSRRRSQRNQNSRTFI